MPSNNSRDVKMTLSVDTLGEENIRKLQTSVAGLAKEGGDAAPEFQKLADEIGRIGQQASALQAFTELANETSTLAQRQEAAAASASELRTRLDALSASTQAAVERQRATAAALNDAQQAARTTRDELSTLTATTDRAGKSEVAYASEVQRLKLAKIEQRAEIERLSAALSAANQDVNAAEQAEAKLASSYRAASTEAERAGRALETNAAQVRQAAGAALDLGVTTDDIAASQTELVQSLNRTGRAAEMLQQDVERLGAAQRELAAQRAFEKQADDARKMLQAAQYVRFWREELDKAEAQAKRTAEEARLSAERISSAFSTLGVRSVQDLNGEIAQVRAAMETVRTSAGVTGGALNAAFSAGEARIKSLEREIRAATGSLTIADKTAKLFHHSITQMTAAMVMGDVIGSFINKVKEMGHAFVDTIVQAEQMRRGLLAVHKDSATAAAQFQFLKTAANTAGVAVGDIQQAFVKFSAATQSAGIGLDVTNQLFAEVTRAAGTLGLSGEQVNGMLEALAQMASKGVVSMEELRQQLGDQLPGALSLVAKGLGLSDAALMKLVESGGLAARDLFPALTKALGDMRGTTDGLLPSYERLKNVLMETAQNAGDSGWTQILTLGLKTLTAAAGAILLPMSAFFEILFGGAKAVGVLVGALFSLTNPMEELKRVAQEGADRQARLTQSFKDVVTGTQAATTATDAHSKKMAEAGAMAAMASGAITTTAKAQEAQSFSAKLAADSTLDLSAKIVQLKAFIDELLSAQTKQIEAAGKMAKGAKIEGDALIQLAELRGRDFETLEAQATASTNYAETMAVLATAQRTETELLILKRDEIVKTSAAQGALTEDRKREIDEISKKIAVSQAETEQTKQAAAAAQQETNIRRLAVQTYKDNSAAISEYKRFVDAAERTLAAFIAEQEAGRATDEEVATARRRAAEATHLYNDAVKDSIAALGLESRVKQANTNITLTKLQIEQRNYESLAQAARASGDYAMALYYEIEARRRQIETIRVTSEMKRLEAEATLKALEIERAALSLNDPLLKQKQAEIDIRIANAKAKLLEANAGADVIRALEKEISLLRETEEQRARGRHGIDDDTDSRHRNTEAIDGQTAALRRQKSAQYDNEKFALDSTGKRLEATGDPAPYMDPSGSFWYFTDKNGALRRSNTKPTKDPAGGYTDVVSVGFSTAGRVAGQPAWNASEGAPASAVTTPAPIADTPTRTTTQTVNINIPGKSATVQVASQADSNTLVSILRQLESAAGTAT